MSSAALKSLGLTAFRGSAGSFVLPFEKGRKLTLVYGENGSGKTTICDGFEFLAKGEVGSLADKGMGAGLKKYWHSLGKSPSDVEVTLTHTDGSSCTGKFAGANPAFELEENRPAIELLRQKQITALIEAEPAKRYKAIQRFVDIVGVEKSEQALKQACDGMATDLSSAQGEETLQFENLDGLYEAAGKTDGIDALAWAKAMAATPTDDQSAELIALANLVGAAGGLEAYPALLQQLEDALEAAQTKFAETEQALTTALESASSAAAETAELLKVGKEFLHAHPDPETCPLCESAENATGLAQSIEKRLEELNAVSTAQTYHSASKQALESVKTALEHLKANYIKSRESFAAAKSGYSWGAAVQLPSDDPPEDMTTLTSWLEESASNFEAWKNREASLRQGDQQRQAVEKAVERFESAKERREEAERLLPHLEAAHKICVETRQAFTNAIMAEIAGKVGELYEKVHPGEGLEKIALQLDPKKRSSVDMHANFAGSDVPPPAYFSQSHLDTLGLCVFLALALREKPGEKILILDDVLGSVDEPHVERVIGMLYEFSQQFQHTIITTHYRPWREKFRWGRLRPDQQCQFVELTNWALDGGIRMKSTVPEIARLQRLLSEEDPDLQAICGKAGVILEEALDFLTLQYQCSVPRKHIAAFTLGELLPAIRGGLRTTLKVETVSTDAAGQEQVDALELKPILDELGQIAQTRNLMGAHFNSLSFDLLDADAMRFGQLVEQLASALVCQEHGWPNRPKTGSYWQNGGDTRRLHPLQKPS
ncbi:AAA family ATPase [Altererythrobacter sp. ZODW24]|uniref:AAA family ATPase n=1 Tax=Altererythrobacter sp. ZODW24 TaxID=2185142 RepID=UPI000DF83C7A|nr:AAA family ATPase [Altererythrobacter sp. ZODW24]